MRAPWLALAAAAVLSSGAGCRSCDGGGEPEPEPEASAAPTKKGRATKRVAPSKYDLVDVCPERLAGIEAVDRVIPAGCGPIRVARGYRVDAGSLTIGAGAILEFERGAELGLGFLKKTKVEIRGDEGSPVILRPAPPEEGEEELPAAGAWAGIRLYKGATDAVIANAVFESVGDPDKGAIYVECGGVTVENVAMRGVGGLAVYVNSKGGLRRFAGNTIENLLGPTSMFLPAASMSAITDNTIPKESTIRLLGDHLRGQHRWADPGVPVIIGGRVEIAGTPDEAAVVTFAPGLDLRFDNDGYVNVGYYDPGVLVAVGSGDKPIRFSSYEGRGPGAWRGVNLYKHASATFAHVVFEHGARYVDRGVLYANSEAEISLRQVTFRDNRSGIVLYRDDIRLREFEGVRYVRTPRPLKIDPEVFGALGEGNDFGGERVLLDEGIIERDTTWRDPGVDVEARGPIAVDGATLRIAGGFNLVVRDGFGLEVGKQAPASLEVLGGDAPVSITGLNDKRGTWDSIHLYAGETPKESAIRGLRLRNAGGDAAIVAHTGARASVTDVACDRCFSPTLSWECGAQVEASKVEATNGTPRAILEPRCGG